MYSYLIVSFQNALGVQSDSLTVRFQKALGI